jgi:hypothetical protein
LVALPNLDHDFFKSSFLSWTRGSLRAVAGELDVSPRDLITEYTKLNADRAVRMLAQWERFPVELFKLVAIQRSRPVISAVRTALQAMDRLPVRPPDWVDPFDDRVVAAAKRASYEAHLNMAETAALTAQAKAERTLENVAKARRMLADPASSADRRAQLAMHRATGPGDDQLAVGSLPTRDRDPNRPASKRTRQRRELRYRNRQKMLANLQTPAPRAAADRPATPAPHSDQTGSANPPVATVVSSSEDEFALLIEESEHFSDEEVQFESSRRVYVASPPRAPSPERTRKRKKKSGGRRISWSSSPESASRARRAEDDREEHAMFLSAIRIRDAGAAASSSSGAGRHDKRKN